MLPILRQGGKKALKTQTKPKFNHLLFACSDLGVHVDGFISNVAHSFIVGVTKV